MIPEILRVITQVAMVVFIVGSMAAMGLGLTIPRIVEPLRDVRLVVALLVANFVVVPGVAIAAGRLLPMEPAAASAVILIGCAAGAPFLPEARPAGPRQHRPRGRGDGPPHGRHGLLRADRRAPRRPGSDGRCGPDRPVADRPHARPSRNWSRRPRPLPGPRRRLGRARRPGVERGASDRHLRRDPPHVAGHPRRDRDVDLRGHRARPRRPGSSPAGWRGGAGPGIAWC